MVQFYVSLGYSFSTTSVQYFTHYKNYVSWSRDQEICKVTVLNLAQQLWCMYLSISVICELCLHFDSCCIRPNNVLGSCLSRLAAIFQQKNAQLLELNINYHADGGFLLHCYKLCSLCLLQLLFKTPK